MTNAERQPGDIILDFHVPHLGSEEREEARHRLEEFALLLRDMAIDQARAFMHRAESPEGPAAG